MIKCTHVVQAFIVEVLKLANIPLLNNDKRFDNIAVLLSSFRLCIYPLVFFFFLRIVFKKVFPTLLISGQ